MLLISHETLRELVSMREAVDAVRGAFIELSAGDIEQPTRVAVGDGSGLAMIARDRKAGGIALKAITIRSGNQVLGLPNIQALVIWFDGITGTPLAAIDGASLTAMRTGAASGVATDHLADDGVSVLAVIGAGAQAPDQVRAVCTVRPISEVRIAARSIDSARTLASKLASEMAGTRFLPCESIVEAVSGAEVICTATNSRAPLFEAADLKARVHVNAIGAYTLAMRELPAELLRDADLVAIDEREAILAEAGDLVGAIEQGALRERDMVEIGLLLAQDRIRYEGRTVFKSVGVAAQDLALARLASEKAAGMASLPTFSF